MKLLNFGSCNIDYVYQLDHIVAVGETEIASRMECFPGGKGLNQSIAAARAGATVFHAGCIGEDGEFLRDTLKESGVDTTYLRTLAGRSGHAIIQVSARGENAIFPFPSTNGMITCEFVDEVLSHFERDDILLLQNEINNLDYIVKAAHARGMRIVLNPSPFNDALRSIDFGMLWCVVLNEVEASEVVGGDDPRECLTRLRMRYPALRVMLTLGKEGCIYADERETVSHPAFLVKAVDTTAAGDTFMGYFLAALMADKSPREAIRMASAASALAVSRKGAAPSIPAYPEVEEALLTLAPAGEAQNAADRTRESVEAYLDGHLADATLTALAKNLGYSAVYTGALVRRVCGKSFTELLRERRIRLAAKLLREDRLSVEEIIAQVGYKNRSFFREHFREAYGKTPRDYRNMMRGKEHDA